MYRYNSYHKIITVLVVMAWAVFHFSRRTGNGLYYDNGQIKQTGETKNALNEGTWTWYFENGKVQMQGQFHEGQREGVWYEFDEEGHISSESHYRKNRLNGDYFRYDTTGRVILHQVFKNDTLVK